MFQTFIDNLQILNTKTITIGSWDWNWNDALSNLSVRGFQFFWFSISFWENVWLDFFFLFLINGSSDEEIVNIICRFEKASGSIKGFVWSVENMQDYFLAHKS